MHICISTDTPWRFVSLFSSKNKIMQQENLKKDTILKIVEDFNKGIESLKFLQQSNVNAQRYEEAAQARDLLRRLVLFRDSLKEFLQNGERDCTPKVPHYQQLTDQIFAKGDLWKYRTLRTLFDPHASEYSKTTPEQKAKIMSKILTSDMPFEILVDQYKNFYRELGKPNVVKNFEMGLLGLIDKNLMEEVCWI